MKPKTMILMVVAVVCGLGASYMTSRLLAEREDQQPTTRIVEKQIEKIPVLLARKNVEMSTLLKNPKDYFVEHQVPKDDTWKDALSDWKALENKTLRRQVGKGRHVTAEDLGDSPPVLEIPPGHVAMGVSVTVHTTAGGFASLPGSRVDINWTRKGSTDDTSFTKTLLQNVLVLAADGLSRPTGDATAIPASVVTLALTPEDARRVSNAAENGTMRLMLREPGNNSIIKDTLTTLAETVKGGGKEPPREEVAIEPVPLLPKDATEPPVQTVEVKPIPEPKPRKMHIVWHRDGPRQWKEVFYLDDDGNVITDDVQREDAPQVSAQPQLPPGPTPPAQPAVPPGPSQPAGKN